MNKGHSLLKLFSGNPTKPMMKKRRCLRNYGSNCAKCIDYCPEQALALQDGEISLNKEKCTGCTLCAGTCPGEIFIFPNGSPKQIMEKIWAGSAPLLTCPQSNAGHGVSLPCLGSLSAKMLIWLQVNSQKKVVYLDLSACDACKYGTVTFKHLRAEAKQLEEFFVSWDIPGYRLEMLAEPEQLATIQQEEACYSRKELFSLLTKSMSNTFHNLLLDQAWNYLDDWLEPEEELLEGLSLRHRLLASVIPKMSEERISPAAESWKMLTSENSFWGYWSIDDRCTGCLVCVKTCPTKALRTVKQDNLLIIQQKVVNCINCHNCLRLCPESALALRSVIPVEDLVNEQLLKIICLQLSTCSSCGEGFYPKQETGLCGGCQQYTSLTREVARSINQKHQSQP